MSAFNFGRHLFARHRSRATVNYETESFLLPWMSRSSEQGLFRQMS